MLLSAVLTFQADAETAMPRTCGNLLHGWLLNVTAEFDQALARRLHDAHRSAQAFSVSEPLDPETRVMCRDVRTAPGQRRWQLAPGDSFVVRVGSTDPALSALLSVVFREGAARAMRAVLGGAKLRLVGAHTGRTGEDGEAASAAPGRIRAVFAAIADDAVPSGYLVHFRTPTAFRGQGRLQLFPTPELVIRSARARWNASVAVTAGEEETAPLAIGSERLAALEASTVVAGYDLRTEVQRYPNYTQRGFVGRCGYDLTRADPEVRRTLGMLLDFAFFSGVGYKASMGMGSIAWPEHAPPRE